MQTRPILLFLLMLAPQLTSCTPYKMDIRQGNFLTPEMRAQLKIGMTKSQVRYALGTPMVSDAFHENRWDYVYRFEHQGKLVEQQGLTLYFEGDSLARIVEGGQPVAAAPAGTDTQVKE